MKPKRAPATTERKQRPPKTRKNSGSADTTSHGAPLHERIARRAYEIYERRLRQGALDDWLQAERKILEQERPKRKPPKDRL